MTLMVLASPSPPEQAIGEPIVEELTPRLDAWTAFRRVAGLPPPHPFCVFAAHARTLNASGSKTTTSILYI